MNDQDSQFDSLLPPLKLDRRASSPRRWRRDFRWRAGGGADGDSRRRRPAGRQGGIPVADGKMPAHRAAPQGKKNLPTLLVVSEIFGVHEYIQDICRRLAHLGIWRWRPSCSRQGDPSRYTDIPKLQAEIISRCPTRRCSATWTPHRPGPPSMAATRADWASWVLLGRTPGLALRRAQSRCARALPGTGSWAASPAS